MAQPRALPSRRDQIVEIARKLFLSRGYDETSMDLVTREAGASKQTVYRYFPSKETLFRAVAEAILAERTPPPAAQSTPPRTRAELEKALLTLAGALVASEMNPEQVALLRLACAETNHAPELGALFRQASVGRSLRVITELLEQARRDCLVACEDPEAAAKLFLGGITVHLVRDGLLVPDSATRPPSAAELGAHVKLVLRALA